MPDAGGELSLYQRGQEFSIRIAGRGELMNSRVHGSEEALALLACARLAGRQRPRLLIGGLGMGFTWRPRCTARSRCRGGGGGTGHAVVAWNRGALGAQAGNPLRDARVTVREIDVARVLRAERNAFDAILLDVDNGPEGLTRDANDWLYGHGRLAAAFAALRADGLLAVWSAGGDREFTDRLRRAGFEAEEIRVRARQSKGGAAHHLAGAARRGVTLSG